MAKVNGIASNGASTSIDSDSLIMMNECIICHEEFDIEHHIPKMLDFCHHSLCITCIKVLFSYFTTRSFLLIVVIIHPLEKLLNNAILKTLRFCISKLSFVYIERNQGR